MTFEAVISGRTRLYPVVGSPVSQVQAPTAFNPLFAQCSIDAVVFALDHGPALPCLSGEGMHTDKGVALIMQLDRLGYRGDYSFEVFNDDDDPQLPLPVVAQRARTSALWLAEDVLQRSMTPCRAA